jgi:two-component system response regulator FixJ
MSTMQHEQTIYVIDDDDAVRQSLEFMLKAAGIKARSFESAKAFMAMLPEIGSGCVVTDVRMP